MNRSLVRLALAGLLLGGTAPCIAAPGAAIYIAGEAGGNLTVWNSAGALIDGGDCGYDVSDGFAVGDVDGNGADDPVRIDDGLGAGPGSDENDGERQDA